MLPLILLFFSYTVIASPPDNSDVFVNEWGVVVFTSEGTTITGAPDENGNLYYGKQVFGEMLVDAPLIWIHGAPFTKATFTVKAAEGSLTALFPEPYSILNDDNDRSIIASWNISGTSTLTESERPRLEIPPHTPFSWAMNFWREVPSLDLFSSETEEYMANFLYYEIGIPYWEALNGIFDAKTLAGHYAPNGLLITYGQDPQIERIQLIPLPNGSGIPFGTSELLTDQEVCDIISDWAGDNLTPEEITALWQTWKPLFTISCIDDEYAIDRRGLDEQWILFPLPWDVVEEISTIHLEIHASVDRKITYNRLFLGLVRLN